MPSEAPPPRTGAQATVVVVNWNGAHLLPLCLDALAAQTTTHPYEVVVVDNASHDDSLQVLAGYPDVRVVRNADNRGFAGGNNSALEHVTTPYAVLLNNDARPEPGWLEAILAPFQEPGSARLAAVSSKVVFAPRFLPLRLSTPGFSPGAADPRELGVKIFSVAVDGADVTARVLWERLVYGAEGAGEGRFRWTRARGDLLVPLPEGSGPDVTVIVRLAAERGKDVTLTWDGGQAVVPAGTEAAKHSSTVTAAPTTDVVQNAGSIVFVAGYGADRGFQEPDTGQYDTAQDVFAICGCAVAFRTAAGREAGWFDDDFFLYYEDTDLSWRLRQAGWTLRYEPAAVVRHVHAASSVEWSPTFVFHTTRNRLLMLAKNATAERARHEWAAFFRETLTMVLLALKGVLRGRRPALRPLQARLRAASSLLRLTPHALRQRRALGRTAVVSRSELEGWLVTSR